MDYLTAKEQRVEKAWSKRGLAGLRSELLEKVDECIEDDWEDSDFVKRVALYVYSVLPKREWKNAETWIKETCGMIGVDDVDVGVLMQVRLDEETLRTDIGDDFDE